MCGRCCGFDMAVHGSTPFPAQGQSMGPEKYNIVTCFRPCLKKGLSTCIVIMQSTDISYVGQASVPLYVILGSLYSR